MITTESRLSAQERVTKSEKWLAGLDAAWAAEPNPVLFVTPRRMAEQRARVADASDAERGEPWYRAWKKTRESARENLEWTPEPYLGPERTFWPSALASGSRAESLAMAYAVLRDQLVSRLRCLLEPDVVNGRAAANWWRWQNE